MGVVALTKAANRACMAVCEAARKAAGAGGHLRLLYRPPLRDFKSWLHLYLTQRSTFVIPTEFRTDYSTGLELSSRAAVAVPLARALVHNLC